MDEPLLLSKSRALGLMALQARPAGRDQPHAAETTEPAEKRERGGNATRQLETRAECVGQSHQHQSPERGSNGAHQQGEGGERTDREQAFPGREARQGAGPEGKPRRCNRPGG
jgi:hypothetical protein